MATTQNTYTGNNSTTEYSFTFPYLEESDVKVSLDDVVQATTEYSFANATTISFNTAPGTDVAIRIFRETDTDSARTTFFAGSAIRAQDLNDNNNQLLYSTQETINRRVDSTGGTMTGDLTFDDADIVFEGATDDAFETTLTVVDPTADRTITLPDVTGTVVTTGDTGTVATAMIAADAVNGTKIADDSIDSEHYVDLSIDTAHIGNLQVTTGKIAADAVDGTKIADNAIDSEHYTDGSIDRVHLAADIVDGTKLADDAVDSEHIADGAIDLVHMSANSVDSDQYVDGSIDRVHLSDDIINSDKLASDAVTSRHYVDGSIDRVHLAADIIDGSKIADDVIDSEHYVDQSIDAAHLATDSVTTGKINADAITNAKIADNAVQQENINGLTATIAELNQLDGNTLSNSSVDWTSGTTFPSASQISARLESFGGFEAIADDESFPDTAPAEGVIISIANAGGLTVNASGTSTNGDTLNDTTVTINNFPSGFNSTTLDDGIGLLVVATSTAHTYNFHRVVAKDEDVRQLSSDIDDFKARYRVGSTNPTTDLDEGDLFYNTGSDTMLVYDGSAWSEVQSIGEYFIIPASDFPTWNGTINDISITDNAPANAEQIILSINGVIQEPNSGTARPTDGFSLNGSTIQLSDPPATGSDAWGVIIGSTVNIGTPSANTVGPTQLIDTAVTAGSYTLSSITVDAQGRITAASSGTAADPDIITEGDTSVEVVDTGSDGQVRLTTDGTRAMTIDSSQNVGIGTASPASTLHINEGTNKNLRFDGGITEIGSVTGFFALNDAGSALVPFGMRAEDLRFATGSAERARIDDSGRLLVGTTSSTANTAGDDLQIAGSSDRGLTITSGSSSSANIYLGDDGDTDRCRIAYQNGDDALDFSTNGGGTDVRIDSSGRLLVGTTSTSATESVVLQGNSSGATSYGSMMLARGTSSPNDGASLGNIEWSDNTHSRSAIIRAERDAGTWSSSSLPTRLGFFTTADSSTTPTERIRLTNDGITHIGPLSANAGSWASNMYGALSLAGNANTGEQALSVSMMHSTHTAAIMRVAAERSASTAYDFARYFSDRRYDESSGGDQEFRLRGDGAAFADASWNGGGADYAEYFEWSDGNTSAEDRRGISVVLDGNKIREAVAGEDPIGVISGNPSVVGDAAWNKWDGKYLRDEFGTYIQEDYEVEDEDGNTVVQQRRKLNPAYDSDVEYISREQRPEWDCVGLMGKLRIRKGQVTGARWIKMRDISDTVEEWLVR